MLEVLQFIFSSFWVWLGTIVLVATFGATLANALMSLRK